jgi:Protein of unknown function (DUF2690)
MRRILTLIVPALLLAALLSSYMGITKISASTADPLVHHVSCSGNGCDGLDPQSTGCSYDAVTVPVSGGTVSFSTGTIELRYSPTCGTNWGRVISSVGNVQLTVFIRRHDGMFYFTVGNGYRLWSPMIYARHARAMACGSAGQYINCTRDI